MPVESKPWIVWVCPTCGELRSVPETPGDVARCWCKMPTFPSAISQMDHSTLMDRVEVVPRSELEDALADLERVGRLHEKAIGYENEAREAVTLRHEVERLRAWIDSEGRDCPSSATIDALLGTTNPAAVEPLEAQTDEEYDERDGHA